MNAAPQQSRQPDDAVLHSSSQVYCSTREESAVISVIERTDTPGPIRFVLWCSLRGTAECEEHCLR